jgi:hypothetical protein
MEECDIAIGSVNVAHVLEVYAQCGKLPPDGRGELTAFRPPELFSRTESDPGLTPLLVAGVAPAALVGVPPSPTEIVDDH